jgi:glyoxylase-like metal-dependent hydrolase (beta-lactamase superfamily II)
MKQLADDVYQLRGLPPNAMNVYLVGDVLVDAATRHARRRILRQLVRRALSAHVVTHAHPDHQGSSHAVCVRRGVPLWCGEADAPAIESGRLADRQPRHPMNRLSERAFAGPGHPVARRLREGDEVAGFAVLETPGHSAGHIALWRARDGTLILGDVLFGCHPLTGIPGLHEPPGFFTPDPARNRESARRLASLEPALVLFGHGPPLREPAALRRFVAALSG